MSSLILQFLLESLLAPSIIASIFALQTRWLSGPSAVIVAIALAFLTALGTTYVLAFGWPDLPPVGARQKIIYSAVIGISIGLLSGQDRRMSGWLFATASILIPVWIGWPLLTALQPKAFFLLLPIAVGLWTNRQLVDRPQTTTRLTIMLIAFAIGLAIIAVSAQTFSLAQLTLATAAGLGAILVAGPRPPVQIAPIAATVVLIALMTALGLYSEAHILALAVLPTALIANRLTLHFGRGAPVKQQRLLFAVFCLIPPLATTGILWIDAGINPLY